MEQDRAAQQVTAQGAAVLVAENLRKVYPDPNSGHMVALDGVSLSAAAGEFVAVVGPSGGGKSTLLRLLAGLIMPDSGGVWLRGERLTSPRREIGFVFQRSNLMPWRTVLENVALPLEVDHVPHGEAQRRAAELVDLVGLPAFAGSFPSQLSGGMQQRVALARALVHDPSVLLLDEPFGSLDALTRERMNTELLRIWGLRRATVVMVTHNISEAVYLADRVLVMTPRPGRIRAEFAVPFPRPRAFTITQTPEFVALAAAVRNEIV